MAFSSERRLLSRERAKKMYGVFVSLLDVSIFCLRAVSIAKANIQTIHI
jgi:hypothetical protein